VRRRRHIILLLAGLVALVMAVRVDAQFRQRGFRGFGNLMSGDIATDKDFRALAATGRVPLTAPIGAGNTSASFAAPVAEGALLQIGQEIIQAGATARVNGSRANHPG